MSHHVIQSAAGVRVQSGRNLYSEFNKRHPNCRIWWGDHYRVMKRRTDPPTLVHKCKSKCKHAGEQLHRYPPLERVS